MKCMEFMEVWKYVLKKQYHTGGSAVVVNISTAVIRRYQAIGRVPKIINSTTSSLILLLYNSSTSTIY